MTPVHFADATGLPICRPHIGEELEAARARADAAGPRPPTVRLEPADEERAIALADLRRVERLAQDAMRANSVPLWTGQGATCARCLRRARQHPQLFNAARSRRALGAA